MNDKGIRHSGQEIPLLTGYAPYALARSPDGSVWVTLVTPGALAQVDVDAALAGADTDSVVVSHRLAGGPAQPMQVTVDADATVWYTRSDDRVGRRDAAGSESLIELPEGSAPYGICAASGGGVWFTAAGLNRVGRVLSDGTLEWTALPLPAGWTPPARCSRWCCPTRIAARMPWRPIRTAAAGSPSGPPGSWRASPRTATSPSTHCPARSRTGCW